MQRDVAWAPVIDVPVAAAVALGIAADHALGGQATGRARSIDLQFGLRDPSSFVGGATEFTGVVAHVLWDFGFIVAYTAVLLWVAKRRWRATARCPATRSGTPQLLLVGRAHE